LATGQREAAATHAYDAAGVYTISATVADGDGGSHTQQFQYVVVYDVDAGFVTGGGWIASPPGAYAADPSLAGKANFGFVSRYQKGATVPTGETEFNFKLADLNFHSQTYEWLVVAGPKAMYKGEGTINGQGDYGFLLTAVDAAMTPSTEDDLFRIKIWDKANADAIVYDNLFGASDDAAPTTALGGGSIVIHTGGKDLRLTARQASEAMGRTVTSADLAPIFRQALAFWRRQGVPADQLAIAGRLHVEAAELDANLLGMASESTDYIWIDLDAAGYGWTLAPATKHYPGVDLLSTITHEVGHKLGFEHDVLGARLSVGERRLPSPYAVQIVGAASLTLGQTGSSASGDRASAACDQCFDRWHAAENRRGACGVHDDACFATPRTSQAIRALAHAKARIRTAGRGSRENCESPAALRDELFARIWERSMVL
jgi:hypothetical protein